MCPTLLSKYYDNTDPLIESLGADWTHIGLFTRMDTLMFTKRSAVCKGLPAEPTAVRPLSSMDADMYLLRATGAERFATIVARERTGRILRCVMAVTMTHQRSTIGELLSTVRTCHCLVPVWYHVPTGSLIVMLTGHNVRDVISYLRHLWSCFYFLLIHME